MTEAAPIERRERRYRSLIEAARGLLLLVTLEDVVRHLLSHVPSIMECAACSLYLPEARTRELVIYSAHGGKGRDAHVHTARIPWDRGIAGRVYQSGRAVIVDDANADPAFHAAFDARSSFQTRAVLCLPLHGGAGDDGGTPTGVIQALNPLSNGPFDAFDLSLMEGVAAMVSSALARLERDRQLKTMARVAGEIAAAQEIQRSLLPPPEVALSRALVLARYQPARSLGGDFYVAQELPDGSFLAAVGDVSGKGIPAALTTAQILTEIDAQGSSWSHLCSEQRAPVNLARFVTSLNRQLCARIAPGRFIAVTFLRYVPEAGMMEIVRAGQFAPWRMVDGAWTRLESPPAALPLGVDPETPYAAESLACAPGEQWLLASDGITEGRDAAENEYGLGRFEASLQPGGPFAVLDGAWEAWRKFVIEDDLHDDACLLHFTCLPPARAVFPARPASCKHCRSYVEAWAIAAGLPDAERGLLVLGVDEAFTNLVRHAPGGEGQPIAVSGELAEGELRFRLRSPGPAVDIARLPVRPLDWEEGKPGGMGLHYIRKIFDRIECGEENGLAVTLLGRKLTPAPAPI